MDAQPPAYSLAQLVRYMLGLGTVGFGGPVALAGFMYPLNPFRKDCTWRKQS